MASEIWYVVGYFRESDGEYFQVGFWTRSSAEKYRDALKPQREQRKIHTLKLTVLFFDKPPFPMKEDANK